MTADRPYGEFYDFYSVSPEYCGYTLVCMCWGVSNNRRLFLKEICVGLAMDYTFVSDLLTEILWTSIQENVLNGFVDSKSKGAWSIILASLIFISPIVYSRSPLCLLDRLQRLQFIPPRIFMKVIHST
jgi:hypothetical protein